MMELIQKTIFKTTQTTIFENKLIYKTKVLFGMENEVNITFENLLRYKESYIVVNSTLRYVLWFLLFITTICLVYRNDPDFEDNAWIFWAIVSLIFGLIYWVNRQNLWKLKLSDNTYIFLFKKIPSETDVENFIDTLFKTRDHYLKETYLKSPTKNIQFENQKNIYDWLYKIDVIDKNEHIKNLTELEIIFNTEIKVIGFN